MVRLLSRRMKDSGIEWIGEIPEDWDTVRTKVAFKVISGATPKSGVEKYWDGDIAWVTPSDFKTDDIYILNTNRMISEDGLNSCGTEVVPVNSIIISNRAPIGSVALNGIPLCTNQGCKSLTSIANENYNKFFYYYFSIMDSSLNMLGRGTTFLELSTFDLKNFMIPYPNYNNQQKIANFLDKKVAEIDHILEKTRESIEEYKKYKQSIITEAVTKGLNPDVKMKDSGIEWIGEIPEHWDLLKLRRIIRKTQNGLTRRNLSESNGVIVLKLKNITSDGNIDLSEINRIELTESEEKQYCLSKNDFLFVRVNGSRALVGKCAIYGGKDEVIAYNDHIIRVQFTDKCSTEYLHWFLISEAGRKEIETFIKTAAGQYTISGEDLRNVTISIPSLKEQSLISEFLNEKTTELNFIIKLKEGLIEEINSYKKSLIYECVTGKREVI